MASLSLHNLKPARGSKSTSKRVGRGNSSGKGTTAGRGTKGQKARTGGRNKLKLLGIRRLVMSSPKLRGFSSLQKKSFVLGIGEIASAFADGAQISPKTLAKKGLVPTGTAKVKILADGSVKKKLVVIGCSLSVQAKEMIIAAGGEVRS